MKFVLRSDLGGRASELAPLLELANVKIKKPMVILVGGNGAGKSSLFAALRQATGLVGEGTGAFEERDGLGKPLPFPRNWGKDTGPVDLARHALLVTDNSGIWDTDVKSRLRRRAVGVLDPVALGWTGQRVWLHSGREIDNHGLSMDMATRRRSGDDSVRSHGQQMTGRLRYAVAWSLGLVSRRDGYDAPEPPSDGYSRQGEIVPREIFARLAGHRPDSPERTEERWLLLDEPEVGMAPMALARMLALVAAGAEKGRMRAIVATHSPLALELASHPNVQILDMDGYVAQLDASKDALASPKGRREMAAAEYESLRADCEVAMATDRGLEGQGKFTAHEAQSVPYADAIVPPYGDPSCIPRMRSSIKATKEAAEAAPFRLP